MKTVGMIAGMSWESSLEYYRILNETVAERLGGLHSAKCLMYSVDFAEIEALQSEGRWDEATSEMVECGRRLKNGGAEFLVICTNTMHKMADAVERQVGLPLLHIADAAARAVLASGATTIGLLGTRFTMEEDFYTRRLSERFGLNVLIPGQPERDAVHRIIYEELVKGVVREESRDTYLRIIAGLADRGCESIVLACTEIGLLVKAEDAPLPLFDTTVIHARAAALHALGEE